MGGGRATDTTICDISSPNKRRAHTAQHTHTNTHAHWTHFLRAIRKNGQTSEQGGKEEEQAIMPTFNDSHILKLKLRNPLVVVRHNNGMLIFVPQSPVTIGGIFLETK